ncbi:LOW QUALITY PROTEIN: hypothetical protein HID58_033904 [Brassica napus]|uniref:Reverse transcriptase zinc-binding domain-containing protein n=1 Tax=Brassica napus TaxID=3708 RepID=A0ABQ8C1T0_BRANA|nr:LOW QUALITY PROTEIN: hypothetical protein HID58_033904 [Brassica napus]
MLEKIQVWKDQWFHGGENEIPTELGAVLFPDLFVLAVHERKVYCCGLQVNQENIRFRLDTICKRKWTERVSAIRFDLPSPSTQHTLITKLWKLKLPPKLKDILVKVLHNGLPVADKRGIKNYNLCQLCGEERETIHHICWRNLYFCCGEIPELRQNYDAMLHFFQYLLYKSKFHSQSRLPFFIRWRIWNMQNKLVFENRREHIIQFVHTAIMVEGVCNDDVQHNASTPPLTQIMQPTNHKQTTTDRVGIMWSFSAIDPTISPLLVEAMAMWLAFQKLHVLVYQDVETVWSFSRVWKLYHGMEVAYISLARYNYFSFHHVPRNQVSVADHLAKRARVNNQGYVISWPNY